MASQQYEKTAEKEYWSVMRRNTKNYLFLVHSAVLKRTQLTFACKHKDWTAEQWSKVVLSDEFRFLSFQSNGHAYVKSGVCKEFREDCLQERLKHGGGGILMWECKGVGDLKKVEGRLNASRYIDLT